VTNTERALRDLRSTFDGDAWHGTPIRTMIAGLSQEQVSAHPIAGARSIAELLAHATAWFGFVERRIRGEVVTPTGEEDFPDVSGVAWADLLDRLDRAQHSLLAAVASLTDEDFDRLVPGKQYDLDYMLRGLVHHTTYHAAQMAMLKKMV
jgi:uncharacterized damage-inducible protein DinB